MAKREKLLPPIHPGEILRADFMEPLGLSMNRLALDLRVPVTRIAEIVHERRGITPDTALRLARYFNTSPGFWLNLQSSYDLEVAQDKFSRTIEREVRPLSRRRMLRPDPIALQPGGLRQFPDAKTIRS
jgi:addiction module HigA family antidote